MARLAALTAVIVVVSAGAAAAPSEAPDASGQARRGQAAVIAQAHAGRRMADGGRVEINSDTAASTNLPLGTTARIRNLQNGRVAIVRVRDRLPSSKGRIVSVTPKVARMLGMNDVAQVEVAPLAVPQQDGSVRLGAGTRLRGRQAYVTKPEG